MNTGTTSPGARPKAAWEQELYALSHPGDAPKQASTRPVNGNGARTASTFAVIPADLRAVSQWVGWKSVQKPGETKPRKLPINPHTNKAASSTDPATWSDHDTAVAAVRQHGLTGVGYVFTADDPFTGIDLDDCRNPDTGEIEPWAKEIIAKLNSYSEVSPSKAGVKIFVRGQLPPNVAHKVDYHSGSIEMYDRGRYFTVTGEHIDSTPTGIEARQAEVMALVSLMQGTASPQARQSSPAAGAVASASIGPGRRTPTIASLIGKLLSLGIPQPGIEAAALGLNATFAQPLPEQKIRNMVADMCARYPAGAPQDSPILKPDLIRLADVEAREVDWLWEPFIPAGMLSLVSGDPGTGKSFIALAVAADLTHGKLRDGRIVEPASVLYLSIENPLAESIRPRFDLLGGDPARFFALRGTLFDEDGEEQRGAVTLADISILDTAIAETRARLVVIDPIQSYLGATVDLHRSNETRPIMDGLSKLAEKHGCAVLLLRHLSKQSGGKAIHRGLGSIDLTGAVRSEMLAGALPDDPEARALVHIKSNVGRMGNSLGYSIDGDGRFAWTGESAITASDLLGPPSGPADHKLTEASQWLTELLTPGSREQREVRDLAESTGLSFATLRRAKNAIRVRSYKATMRGPWLWALPEPKDTESPSSPQSTEQPNEVRL